MSRFEELKSYIAALPADIQAILTPVLHDIVYAEEMLQKFRDNPKTKSNAAMYKAYAFVRFGRIVYITPVL